jgi:hypothetical protein
MRHSATTPAAPDPQLLQDASDAYVAYLVEAYGFERHEVELPPTYVGREIDWFGHVNEVLTQLEDYSRAEVRHILTGRNPWVKGGGSLLKHLRDGEFADVHRILRRY